MYILVVVAPLNFNQFEHLHSHEKFIQTNYCHKFNDLPCSVFYRKTCILNVLGFHLKLPTFEKQNKKHSTKNQAKGFIL